MLVFVESIEVHVVVVVERLRQLSGSVSIFHQIVPMESPVE
jgi:hypothetical protein